MRAVRALVAVAACLMVQQGLARLWPESVRWIDLLLLPPVAYALMAAPRTAMIVGCLAGLLQDVWFGSSLFGSNGFRKTLVAFLIGVIGARLDLNSNHGRFAAGFAAAMVDAALGLGLRELLGLVPVPAEPLAWTVRAILAGVGVAVAVGWASKRRTARR